MHHEASLPITPEAPRIARQEVGSWLDALIAHEVIEQARVAVSELVTNAVQHETSEKAHSRPLRLAVDLDRDVLRVAVEQSGSAERAALVSPDRRGPQGGYGLAIVDEVADRWGVIPGRPGGVWFAMATHR